MKAKINFIQLNNAPEELEIIFEVIPFFGDGVSAFGCSWQVRVALPMVNTPAGNNLGEKPPESCNFPLSVIIKCSKEYLKTVIGIEKTN